MVPADALAWPFAIGGSPSERHEWKTDVMQPPYGPPQTRKLRDTPRVLFEFEGLESARRRRQMETLLHANAAGLWHIPMPGDGTELAASAQDGDEVIAVDTTHRRFRVGGNAIIVDSDTLTHQVLQITAVAAGSITFDAELGADWRAGSLVIPTVAGRLVEAPTLPRFTGDAVPYVVTFRADEPLDWPADFGGPIYRGFPVLEHPIDWSSDPAYTPARSIERVDDGLGAVRYYDQAGVVQPEVRVAIALSSAAEISAFRSLEYALAGRWSPVWVQSFGQDIALVGVVSAAVVDVETFGFAAWEIQPNRQDIRIALAAGAPIYRRIVAAAVVDALTERLQLDRPLPDGFEIDQVIAVSFMALSLQASDTNVMRQWSRDVVLTELAFKGITHEF